jgi:deoxyadenosine/deoxycytidine kinase
VRALSKARQFEVAFEEHSERPFQSLFKEDARYGFANQMDYLLLRAEQERKLRLSPHIGLIDGGLDLDFHGFTRLFHARGWLSADEFNLCRRFYEHTRELLSLPELIIHLTANEEVIRNRLAERERINIASAEDTKLFNSFLDEWLEGIPPERLLKLDVSSEKPDYSRSLAMILERLSI